MPGTASYPAHPPQGSPGPGCKETLAKTFTRGKFPELRSSFHPVKVNYIITAAIKQALSEANVTQEQYAKALHIDPSSVSRRFSSNYGWTYHDLYLTGKLLQKQDFVDSIHAHVTKALDS